MYMYVKLIFWYNIIYTMENVGLDSYVIFYTPGFIEFRHIVIILYSKSWTINNNLWINLYKASVTILADFCPEFNPQFC